MKNSNEPLTDLAAHALAAEKAITHYVKRYADTLWGCRMEPGRDSGRGEAAA
jgi:hypothetical protein